MMYGNSRGQVGVVVAILMVSLVVAVIVIIQVYYVPNWMKEKEAEHMDTVANQFSNLKFSIDLQTLAQIDVPITNSITLGSKELPYFISARAFGSLNVLPPANSNFSVAVSATGAKVKEQQTPSSSPIEDIASVEEFELTLQSLTHGHAYNVFIQGDKALQVTVFKENFSEATGFRIALKTLDGGSEIFSQTIASALPNEPYTINLLDEDYKFATDVLSEMTDVFNISYTGPDPGNFRLVCQRYSNDNVDDEYELGTIQYQSENAYFVDQTYTYQGGAVIISQSDGNAITSPPFFSASNATTQHVFNMSLVDVRGLPGKRSAGGYGTYAIRTNYSSTEYLEFKASSVTLTITTDYPEAWERYLNTTLTASGMQQDVDYNLTIENHQLVVLLYGPSVDSADITFSLQKITVYAQVGPGWVS
ncbi:MAG: hypothetical protein PHU95_00905 [Candidatus Thermoplasmatota archaeon]|nr:hypothetical protein [Candidatus Thermoplasmatota archaeon]MDD5777996.1 hypothetical protein [Candidatus Thermoplasmatota archaeon]